MVFTIYGRGSHLGHVIRTIWTNCRFPIPMRLHMKYELNLPCSFRGEDVWKCWRTTEDGRWSHWYTIISSPMSLLLRWAKKRGNKYDKKRNFVLKRALGLWVPTPADIEQNPLGTKLSTQACHRSKLQSVPTWQLPKSVDTHKYVWRTDSLDLHLTRVYKQIHRSVIFINLSTAC